MIKIKAWNASKTQSIRFAHGAGPSTAIAKFYNAEIDNFGRKVFVHELIRGSLVKLRYWQCYRAILFIKNKGDTQVERQPARSLKHFMNNYTTSSI
jgi:hypothetical protein